MHPPRITLITATDVVAEEVLFERLGGVARLPAEARARLAVQMRDPQLSGRELVDLGLRLHARLGAIGASLIVNDRLDLAVALGAGGVHLGRRSVVVQDAREFVGSQAFISVACHTVDEVVTAALEGADAALLSPIFFSPGKGPPLGLSALSEAKELLRAHACPPLWLIALGGIDAERASLCMDAGADGVAVVRADLGSVLPALLQA